MAARVLDGAAMSAEVLAALQPRVKSLAARGVQPGLATVLVGDNAASRAYVRNKLRTCAETGLHAELHELSAAAGEGENFPKAAEANLNAHRAGHILYV